MKSSTSYVGLDVHKSTISVAIAEDGRGGDIRDYGVVENRADILVKLVERLGRRGQLLHFCYEAGPCGYGLHRLLSGLGQDSTVVAPSLIPKKAGDRVKTNRRDAVMLARLHRAGELTAVWVPDAAHEAMRDLVRHGPPQRAFWGRHGSTSPGSCCAMAKSMPASVPGRWPTGVGSQLCASPIPLSRSSCRTISTPLKMPRSGSPCWWSRSSSFSCTGRWHPW